MRKTPDNPRYGVVVVVELYNAQNDILLMRLYPFGPRCLC